jgi:hypothetical protein
MLNPVAPDLTDPLHPHETRCGESRNGNRTTLQALRENRRQQEGAEKTGARNNDLVGRLQLRAEEKSAATNRPTTNEKPKLEQEKRRTKISDTATPKNPQNNCDLKEQFFH